MNDKLSFQHVVDALVQKTGVSKKVADTFAKAFFDTVVEALYMGEESIKVKGLGTFKLVEVESRESVNVSNGERIVIPGYKKVSFAPEDSVVEALNKGKEEPVAVEEPVPAEEPVVEEPVAAEESDIVDRLIEVPEPKHVELPQDEFAGIDMLISTPESIEEIRQQYEEAAARMETAVEEARKANADKIRLGKLLERLEANTVPESAEEEQPEEAVPVEEVCVETENDSTENQDVEEVVTPASSEPSQESVPEQSPEPSPESSSDAGKRQEAFDRLMKDVPNEPVQEAEPEAKKSSKAKTFWVVTLIVLLLATIVFFLYRTSKSIESVEKVPDVEKVVKPSVPRQGKQPVKEVKKPSEVKPQVQDTPVQKPENPQVKENPAEGQKKPEKPAEEKKPERPQYHRMQRGESLTRISQRYYETKDSVRAIIRVNTFRDPDNVPVGAMVKLP